MKRIRRILNLERKPDEEGMALAIALIFGMIIMIMAATALSVASSGLKKADTDQDWNGALAAAYAGVQEYQSRLSNDNTYQQYGNPAAAFSATSAGSLTLPTGTQTNPAFGVGKSGTWATVAGSTGSAISTATFRYEVDNSQYTNFGTLRLRSTGRVGTTTRTVVADLRQDGFIDYLYFTNYEFQDPQQTGKPTTGSSSCLKYAYQGRPSGCGEIAFGGGDVIAGPAHSNDTMRICQASFTTKVTSSNPATTGLRYTAKDSNGATCTGQKFPGSTTQPGLESSIDMPTTLALPKRETENDLPTDVPRPGCLYTGPTDIVFNADGTMTVKSPYTKKTRTNAAGTSGSALADCGIPGTGTGQLGSTAGATFTVPANNLVYVQNVPTTSSDVNYTSTTASGMSTTSCSNNHVGYPIVNSSNAQLSEVVPTTTGGYGSASPCAYGARNGDAFVKGSFHGQLTIATDNYVYVTNDLTYVDSNSDILGLIGTNNVFVYNPVKLQNGSYVSLLGDSGREIDAAILSSSHSFVVQNFDRGGSRGTLTVKGSIAQNFRGIASNGANGYIKNYGYDARLRYLAPPKFLSPVTTSYGVTTLTEAKTAYAADGTPQ